MGQVCGSMCLMYVSNVPVLKTIVLVLQSLLQHTSPSGFTLPSNRDHHQKVIMADDNEDHLKDPWLSELPEQTTRRSVNEISRKAKYFLIDFGV